MVKKDDGRYVLQLRLPVQVLNYCKAMGQLQFGSLQSWSDDLMQQFCTSKPWVNGLVEWKRPRSVANPGADSVNWRPVNLVLTPPTAALVEETIQRLRNERDESQHAFSESMFAYTAVVWYLTFVNPPKF